MLISQLRKTIPYAPDAPGITVPEDPTSEWSETGTENQCHVSIQRSCDDSCIKRVAGFVK